MEEEDLAVSTAKQSAKTTEGGVEAAILRANSAARHEFENLVEDLEDLIKATSSLTGAEIERLRKQLGERVSKARQTAQSMSDDAITRMRQTARVTDEYVHEQPWKAMGVCASVGFLLGMLVSRR